MSKVAAVERTQQTAEASARRPRPLVSMDYQARVRAAPRTPKYQWNPGVAIPPAAAVESRWRERPVSGFLVRLVALGTPVAASVACTVLASRLVARPTGAHEAVWWVLMAATSTTVLVVVDTVARRLLPLATLLRLSLAFPDRAPSRFSVAFRAGTTRNLKRQVARAQQHHTDADLAASAERILVLAAALSAHDRGTRHHSERVRAYCDLIAEELRLSDSDRDRLRWAALLHDVGKLEVSAGLLRKAGALDSKEWDQIRRHPGDGARIAAPLAGWLGPWAKAIEQHHEQWGGAGYPNGLSGADISLGARIVAVADAFEVMTAPRSYRRPVGANAAREELAHGAGEQFDPAVVRAFLNVSIGRLRWTIGPVAWLAHVPFVALASGRRRVIDGVRIVGAGGALAGLGTLVVGGVPSPTDGAPASSQSTPSASAQLQRGRTDRSAAMSSYPTSTLPDVASIGGQAEGGAGTTAGPAVDTSGPPGKDKSRKRPLRSVRSAIRDRLRSRPRARDLLEDARRRVDAGEERRRLQQLADELSGPVGDRPILPRDRLEEIRRAAPVPEQPLRRR